MSKRRFLVLPLLAGMVLPAALRAALRAELVLQTWRPLRVQSVAWSPDGKRLATASGGRGAPTAEVWDATSGEKILTLRGHPGLVNSVAWSPDSKRLATGGDYGALVWDATSGEKLLTFKGCSQRVRSVVWSPDGKRLATGSQDGTAQVWDAASGEKILTLKGHSHWVCSVAWSSDGKRLASASVDGTARVWDATSGEKLLTLAGVHGDGLSWSPDGKRLAAVSFHHHTVQVWDATSGEKLLLLKEYQHSVWSVAWSPDGKRLATGSEYGTAQVWDARSGEKLLNLKGHSDTIHSVAWSPDSKRLATASWDGTTGIWNAGSGQLLWQCVSLGTDWISFTLQGYYVGSLAAERFIRWRLPAEKGEPPRFVGPEQYREVFYRPDLFRHLLADGDVALALASADAERGTRSAFTSIDRKPPPVVLLTTPRHRDRVDRPEVRVEAIARNVGQDPVTSLQLVVNGEAQGRIHQVQEPRPGQVPDEWPHVRLRPGENTLRVVARAGGIQGESDTITVTYQTREQIKVRLHLLVIGISRYKLAPQAGGYPELRHAADDARRFRDAFLKHGRSLYDDIPEPVLLLDDKADRDGIEDALQAFSERMGKDDVGIVFFAGHGDRHNDRLYLAAHDTCKDRLLRTGISASQLRDTLVGLKKGRKYLFLDACHAGGVLQRSSDDSIHESLIRELRRESAGLVIATACRGTQKANEDETLGGYFTAALVEGLAGKGASPGGVVRGKYLKLYVEERLKELTRSLNADHQQEPLFDGPDELMDLPLARVRP